MPAPTAPLLTKTTRMPCERRRDTVSHSEQICERCRVPAEARSKLDVPTLITTVG